MRRAALSLAILAAPLALAGTVPTWNQVISQSGWAWYAARDTDSAGKVQVYKKTIGDLPCFQGVASTDVSPEILYQVAADIPGTMKWSSAGVKEAEVLGKNGDTMDYYQYLDVPGWTLSNDRFWFLRGTTAKSDGVIVFRWDALQGGGPYADRYARVRAEHPDAVEPPVNVGGWVFSTQDDGTRIQYYVCSDTGGSIPKAVQSAATQRTLPDTVNDLVREGKRRAGY